MKDYLGCRIATASLGNLPRDILCVLGQLGQEDVQEGCLVGTCLACRPHTLHNHPTSARQPAIHACGLPCIDNKTQGVPACDAPATCWSAHYTQWWSRSLHSQIQAIGFPLTQGQKKIRKYGPYRPYIFWLGCCAGCWPDRHKQRSWAQHSVKKDRGALLTKQRAILAGLCQTRFLVKTMMPYSKTRCMTQLQ